MLDYLKTSTMSLLCNGCSFTWGDELEEGEQTYAEILGATNIARCASSNDNIARRTLMYLQDHDVDQVIMQWTYKNRREHFYDSGMVEGIIPQIYKDGRAITKPISKIFYTSFQNSRLDNENMWKNILLVDSYCRMKNIKVIHWSVEPRKWCKGECYFYDIANFDVHRIKKIVGKGKRGFWGQDENWRPRGHLSQLGHKKVADYLYNLL